jgi:membrane protease YdiL (CAAX protease family)
MGAVTGPVDVLAQQLPTFGLIQGLLASRIGRTTAFLLAWSSFAVAHAIFASPQIAIIAVILGGVFGLLLNRTGNLGAGLGLHSTFYLMRSVLGYSA